MEIWPVLEYSIYHLLMRGGTNLELVPPHGHLLAMTPGHLSCRISVSCIFSPGCARHQADRGQRSPAARLVDSRSSCTAFDTSVRDGQSVRSDWAIFSWLVAAV